MEKELRAEDLFVKEQKNVINVDPEYEVVVKLSSIGKLGLPAVVHVRDYSFDDSLLFAKATQNNENSIILELLKSVVFEEIDLTKVTRQDALEILMAIQGTFYTSYIDGKEYFVDDSLKGEALTNKDNISTATININDIKTKPLNDKVSVPITIENSKFKAVFDYPRLIHDVKAREYIENKFAIKDNELSSIMQKKAHNEASNEEIKILLDYDNEKTTEYMRVLTAQQILSLNGKEPKDINEQLNMLHKMPMSVLSLLANILNINFNFGVQDEVTFTDNVTEKLITRRFNFRYSDFLSSVEQRNESNFNVTFG